MTTLRMETDAARSAQNTLNNSHAQLMAELQTMNSAVNNLQATWEGNSATEFYGEYEQYRSAMNQMLEALNVLNTRLANEITEWEMMQSKLA